MALWKFGHFKLVSKISRKLFELGAWNLITVWITDFGSTRGRLTTRLTHIRPSYRARRLTSITNEPCTWSLCKTKRCMRTQIHKYMSKLCICATLLLCLTNYRRYWSSAKVVTVDGLRLVISNLLVHKMYFPGIITEEQFLKQNISAFWCHTILNTCIRFLTNVTTSPALPYPRVLMLQMWLLCFNIVRINKRTNKLFTRKVRIRNQHLDHAPQHIFCTGRILTQWLSRKGKTWQGTI